MTIWEKAVLNVQRGTQKLSKIAAVFSDRVKAEITIARLRIRLDDLNSEIAEQYRVIGRRMVDLQKRSELPQTTEQLMQDEEITAAWSELQSRERDGEDLLAEIEREQEILKPAPKQKKENAA